MEKNREGGHVACVPNTTCFFLNYQPRLLDPLSFTATAQAGLPSLKNSTSYPRQQPEPHQTQDTCSPHSVSCPEQAGLSYVPSARRYALSARTVHCSIPAKGAGPGQARPALPLTATPHTVSWPLIHLTQITTQKSNLRNQSLSPRDLEVREKNRGSGSRDPQLWPQWTHEGATRIPKCHYVRPCQGTQRPTRAQERHHKTRTGKL